MLQRYSLGPAAAQYSGGAFGTTYGAARSGAFRQLGYQQQQHQFQVQDYKSELLYLSVTDCIQIQAPGGSYTLTSTSTPAEPYVPNYTAFSTTNSTEVAAICISSASSGSAEVMVH